MRTEDQLRPLYLDAVDRSGESLLGVKFTIMSASSGKVIGSTDKPHAGYVKQYVSSAKAVLVVAEYDDIKRGPVKLLPSATDHTFQFENVVPLSVLVVCALPLEAEAVRLTFDEEDKYRKAGGRGDPNLYRTGCYRSPDGFERRVLLATSGMGNNNSAIVAIHALRSFYEEVRHVFMVGIAGGCPNPDRPPDHVRLGDVVVSDERGIVQYDFVKRTIEGDEHRAYPQRPGRTLVNAVYDLEADAASMNASWRNLITDAGNKDSRFERPDPGSDVLHDGEKAIAHPHQANRRADQPLVHRGAIGSANILLKDPTARDLVREKWNVRAIEMEGTGVQDAAWSMEKDIMVVRGICDYCDSHKNNTWQCYAALAAAAYTRAILETMPKEFF